MDTQQWMAETPTGKVACWITLLEPKDSLVFELMIINGSGEVSLGLLEARPVEFYFNE